VHTDASHAVTQVVRAAGGTIMTTATDGTTFSLVIPKDALFGPQSITMTPLSSIDGSPFAAGFVGGVDLSPENLFLWKPATLTITSPNPQPAAEEVGFGYHAGGSELHLEPMSPDPRTTSLQIDHFSGHGEALATDQNLAMMQAHPPSSLEDEAAQLQALTARARACQLVGGNCVDPKDLASATIHLLQRKYDEVILKLAKRAATDDTVLIKAGRAVYSWSRAAQLNGFGETFAQQIATLNVLMLHAYHYAYAKSFERCVSEHRPAYGIRMVWIARELQILGDEDVDLSQASNCLKFQLDMETTIHSSNWYNFEFQTTEHVRVQSYPFYFNLTEDELSNGIVVVDGPQQNEQFLNWDLQYPHICSPPGPNVPVFQKDSLRLVSGFQASLDIEFDLDVQEAEGQDPDDLTRWSFPDKIEVSFGPGDVSERWHNSCAPGTLTGGYGFYSSIFGRFYDPRGINPHVRDWQLGIGDAWAQQTYNRSITESDGAGQGTATESTTWVLRHAPGT
jgi:hypothetical protein